jgi:putative sigma-54 modulation protein
MEFTMNIQITGHGIDVTPAIRTFTEDKFSKLDRHYNHIQSCHVTFEIEKLDQIAQATILFNKAEIHAKAQSIDLYSAIDLLLEKLERQLQKNKDKHQNHHTDQ